MHNMGFELSSTRLSETVAEEQTLHEGCRGSYSHGSSDRHAFEDRPQEFIGLTLIR